MNRPAVRWTHHLLPVGPRPARFPARQIACGPDRIRSGGLTIQQTLAHARVIPWRFPPQGGGA